MLGHPLKLKYENWPSDFSRTALLRPNHAIYVMALPIWFVW